jgi:signal transduction histidine kinase
MITIEELAAIPLFDRLSDRQLTDLLDAGEEVAFEAGDELFHEGAPSDSWFVLLEGRIDLIRRDGSSEMVLAVLDNPGRWAGGFRAWDESGQYLATGRAAEHGRILRVPAASLRALVVGWLPLAVHLIDGVFNTARNVEQSARQRSALVTLGTLAAGLAHELNNPASAATRSVESLQDANHRLLQSLARLAADGLGAEQFTALDGLRRQIQVPTGPVDALDISDAEDELAEWMQAHAVAGAWALAPTLATAGVTLPWCQSVADLLGDQDLEPALDWVAGTLTVDSLLAQVGESTRRISELVAAVKSYSQMDRASMQQVDLVEGLESTLVMLGHKLRDGVVVVRDYDPDLPTIEAYAGELNQVWTNLIDNAVDAMDGHGTLRIVTRTQPDRVVVEVCDTGEGMPPAVAERAFEAFFTTKDVGRGTGLGLDIARRIVVQRHGGTISVDSRPGDTTFRVTLPCRPPL